VISQLGSVLVGLWLMTAPSVLGHAGSAAAKNDWIIGPLVVTTATMALWQVLRAVRWVNLAFGAWMVVAAFVLGYRGPSLIGAVIAGLALVVLAVPRGRISHRFGGGWRRLAGDRVSDPARG
jgi:hypothetical protein